MKTTISSKIFLPLFALAALTGLAPASEKPVKVHIPAGHSNMVGIGQVSSNGA